VSIALAFDSKGALAGEPAVESIGIPELTMDGRRFDEVVHEAAVETMESLPRGRRRDPDSVADAVKRGVRAAVAAQWGKKPLCIVHILTI
jgi:ribonuclease J